MLISSVSMGYPMAFGCKAAQPEQSPQANYAQPQFGWGASDSDFAINEVERLEKRMPEERLPQQGLVSFTNPILGSFSRIKLHGITDKTALGYLGERLAEKLQNAMTSVTPDVPEGIQKRRGRLQQCEADLNDAKAMMKKVENFSPLLLQPIQDVINAYERQVELEALVNSSTCVYPTINEVLHQRLLQTV